MNTQTILMPRVTDKTITDFFVNVGKLTGVKSLAITTLGFGNIGTEDLDDPSEELIKLLSKKSVLIDTATMTLGGLYIKYSRSADENDSESGIFSKITLTRELNYQGGAKPLPDTSIIFEIVDYINKKLKASSPTMELGAQAANSKLEVLHNNTLERLEQLNEELISKTHEYRSSLDHELANHRLRLDAEHSKRQIEQDEAHSLQLADLAAERESILKQKQALDDKSNTHARREIRKDILREIKSRQTVFSLTHGTNSLRKPIAGGMILLITFFSAMTFFSSWELYSQFQTADTRHLIIATLKQVGFTAGTVGSILFAIRWMNRWFELHMNSEFALKQLELDMERASWLVETSLEWKEVKGAGMPPELLNALSKNLFESHQEAVESLVHPADQLASALVGSASAIRLQAGDSLLEINPKKLAKARPVDSGIEKS